MSALFLALFAAAELNAEFWGRTVPLKDGQGMMKAVATDTHLVVEVTVKRKNDETNPTKITAGQFRLRVNGAKFDIPPDSPGMAAAFISDPNWEGTRGLEAAAGPVIIGRPRAQPRFPDDPNTRGDRQATGEQTRSLSEAMTAAAWPDGDVVTQRTGLLYFPWKGRVAKIKTLEIVWQAPEGAPQTVKLR